MNHPPYPSDLTAGEWRVLKPLLPMPCKLGQRRKYALRSILDAIFYVPRTGYQWRAVRLVLAVPIDKLS